MERIPLNSHGFSLRGSNPNPHLFGRAVLVVGFLILISWVLPCAAADLEPVPQYKLGDEVANDIVTPVRLMVINPGLTMEQRKKAATRIPAIFHFDATVAEAVQQKFRTAFAKARQDFLEILESTYEHRTVGPEALSDPKFGRVIEKFQRRHKTFPLQTNLFELWAQDKPDELFEAELVTKLRGWMRQYLRESPAPPEVQSGPGQVQMLVSNSGGDSPTFAPQSLFVPRTNLISVSKARSELQNTFGPEDQPLAKYVAGFLRTNCVFDEVLTRETRRRKTATIWATDYYESGQVVARKGGRFTAGVVAALDELRAKIAADHARAEANRKRQEAEATQARLRDHAAQAESQAQAVMRRNRWLLGGLAATVVLSLLALWISLRQKRNISLLPELARGRQETQAVVACPACNEPVVIPLEIAPAPLFSDHQGGELSLVSDRRTAEARPWKERALQAEHRAEKATAILRAGLVPYLARWLMDKLVRGLVSDRRKLIEAQHSAADDVAALEKRLADMQAPLKERLAAYEGRIAELERELAAKGEENRELIKAKIALARQQLAREREKGVAALN